MSDILTREEIQQIRSTQRDRLDKLAKEMQDAHRRLLDLQDQCPHAETEPFVFGTRRCPDCGRMWIGNG